MTAHDASTDRVGAGRVDPAPVGVDLVDPGGLLDEAASSRFKERLGRAMVELGAGGEVRLKLVGDAEMARANARHHSQDSTTDVLTFDLSEGGDRSSVDADLLLCVDEAERQGAARGTGVERELLLYALHGVLHCLGFDDHDEESAGRMHAEEDRVLTAIGVGPTFVVAPLKQNELNAEDPEEPERDGGRDSETGELEFQRGSRPGGASR